MNFCEKFYDVVMSLSIIGYDNYYRYIILHIEREEKHTFYRGILNWFSCGYQWRIRYAVEINR